MRQLRAVNRIAELLWWRIVWVVTPKIGVIRLMAVGSPVPFIFPGVCVEDNHTMIAVAIGDVELVGLRIDKRLGGQPQVFRIVAPFAARRLADLHQEFPVLRELQNHVVVEASKRVGGLSGLFIASTDGAAAAGASTS